MHAARVAVGGIDDDDIDAGLYQPLQAFVAVAAGADGGAGAQLAERILAGVGMFGGLEDVLDRHQPAQFECCVDDQHPFEPVLVHQRLRFVEAGAFAHRDQPLARRHDAPDRRFETGLETQVAIGDDADDGLAFHHRQAGDPVLARERDHFAHRHLGVTVIGSVTTPDSKRLTLATSAACSAGVRFLWMMPMPPSCAIAIASGPR